jgi:hypothetical protein
MQLFSSSHANSLWINGGPNNQVVILEVFIVEAVPFQYLTNLRAFESGLPMRTFCPWFEPGWGHVFLLSFLFLEVRLKIFTIQNAGRAIG